MASQWLKARQTRYAAYAVVYTLVVMAAAVVVNVLADRYDKSYDATANKRYTLSAQTAKIVKSLKQDATIVYFNASTRFQDGKNLLDEYADLSPKVHIQYVDPDKDPQLARADNIHDMGTAVVEIGDKKEAAASMTEEGITGAFIRDLKTSTRTVCFVSGSGERQLDSTGRNGLSELKSRLGEESYDTQTVNLIETAAVPAACTALVVAGPTHDYAQPEVSAIQQYVQNGGRALFLMDPPLQMGVAPIADNSALATVLNNWGVTLDKDLVLDLNPIGQLAGLGPQVALVTSYESQPIVDPLKGTVTGFPLSRSLEIHDTANTTVQQLFQSSGTSLATNDLDSAEVSVNNPKNKKGPMILAAAGTYDTGKSGSQGRFVVVGSSMWASNSFINFNGNSDLALNAINWLASNNALISIRPKPPEAQHLTMTRAQLNMVRIVSQFSLPLAMVILGGFVWWKRR